MTIHLIKLAVDCNTLDDLAHWQATHRHDYQGREVNVIRTRHMPKRGDEILACGGSISL